MQKWLGKKLQVTKLYEIIFYWIIIHSKSINATQGRVINRFIQFLLNLIKLNIHSNYIETSPQSNNLPETHHTNYATIQIVIVLCITRVFLL